MTATQRVLAILACLGVVIAAVVVAIVDTQHKDVKLARLAAHCRAVETHLADDAKLLQDAKPERRDLGRRAYLELVGGDDITLCSGESYTSHCADGDDACLAREALGLVEELRK